MEAKRMIRYSDLRIKEIAFDLGFKDDSYFIKLFKRNVGMSPIEFREKEKQLNLTSSVFGSCLSVSVSIDIYSLHSQYRFLYYLPGTEVSLAWYWSVSMLGL